MLSGSKNILLIILISLSIFLLTSISFIFYLVPHYDIDGKYKLFGQYYDTKHILQLKKNDGYNLKLKGIINNHKSKNIILQEKFKKNTKNVQNLKNIIISQKNKNNSLQQKFKNFFQKDKNNQKTLSFLQNQNENLKNNVGVLKSQLNQQQDFIKTQNIEHKQENKQKQFMKKRQFSNVSKNNITNERPQLGNMFSKSLKKTTTSST
jgi:hypothetical protein